MDAQAKNLSGGQKRKLSVGIAILGDPKVAKNLAAQYYEYVGEFFSRFVCVYVEIEDPASG